MTNRYWTILLLCLGLLVPAAGCDSWTSSRAEGGSQLSVRNKSGKKSKKQRRASKGKRSKRKKGRRNGGRRGWARN